VTALFLGGTAAGGIGAYRTALLHGTLLCLALLLAALLLAVADGLRPAPSANAPALPGEPVRGVAL
jgi:hypothetical protein